MQEVQRAFGGLYKEVNRETQQWYTDTGPVPEPRPGAVSALGLSPPARGCPPASASPATSSYMVSKCLWESLGFGGHHGSRERSDPGTSPHASAPVMPCMGGTLWMGCGVAACLQLPSVVCHAAPTTKP